MERLKTHVKAALVVRAEEDGIRHFFHVGTGNYHPGTARIYEDLGLLSCDPELGTEVATLFNELTGAVKSPGYRRLLVAPDNMFKRFTKLFRREIQHRQKGRPCGIRAKMNQLQDPRMIRELYRAGQAGVPISLNVRGLRTSGSSVRSAAFWNTDASIVLKMGAIPNSSSARPTGCGATFSAARSASCR